MLLQASTHSSNFDENTDCSSLSLTIVAYQWGWSYFFPIDTITNIYTNQPRNIFAPSPEFDYSTTPLSRTTQAALNDDSTLQVQANWAEAPFDGGKGDSSRLNMMPNLSALGVLHSQLSQNTLSCDSTNATLMGLGSIF